MASIIVAASRSIAAHDIFATDFCLNRDVLTDGKTKDVVGVRQAKPIAKIERTLATRRINHAASTHIAVLCDTSIFSMSGNSFHSFGSSTGARSSGLRALVVRIPPKYCLLLGVKK